MEVVALPTPNSPKVRKCKLVTCLVDGNGGNDITIPFYTYAGGSNSEQSRVKITIPMYNQNLLFYEHFDDANPTSPSILAFIYLGSAPTQQSLNDFEKYNRVVTVDIFHIIGSASTIFKIVSKLPKCVQFRIHFTNENLAPSDEEKKELKFLLKNYRTELLQYSSHSLKCIKLYQEEEINESLWRNVNRMDHILEYSFLLAPMLENLILERICGIGRIFDLVSDFTNKKVGLRLHKVMITDGKLSCRPVASTNSSLSNATGVSHALPTFTSQCYQAFRSLNAKISVNTGQDLSAAPSSSSSKRPRAHTLRNVPLQNCSVTRDSRSQINAENQNSTQNDSQGSQNTTTNSPKKVKIGKPVAQDNAPGSSNSLASSSVRSNGSISNSLTAIGSSYDEWESSDDEDTITGELDKEKERDGNVTVVENVAKVTSTSAPHGTEYSSISVPWGDSDSESNSGNRGGVGSGKSKKTKYDLNRYFERRNKRLIRNPT